MNASAGLSMDGSAEGFQNLFPLILIRVEGVRSRHTLNFRWVLSGNTVSIDIRSRINPCSCM
jgi:hypothetical protein